jgi:hypothetical protein
LAQRLRLFDPVDGDHPAHDGGSTS